MTNASWKSFGLLVMLHGKSGKMDIEQDAIAREFDKYDKNYADTVADSVGIPGLKADFFTRVKADYFIDLLNDNLGGSTDKDVLDIGCGVGLYHDYLSKNIAGLQGTDVSQACLNTAKRNNPTIAYTPYDGSRLPYDDNSFDAALTICVMHHVPVSSWESFSSEMLRILKPGGIGAVFEHNPLNPLTMRIVNRCPFDEDAVLLKSSKTESLFNGAGFSDVKSRFILSIPPANRILRNIDRCFSRLPFGAQYYTIGRKPE